MKTLRFLTFGILVITSVQVSAQFSIGVKSGYTRAWMHYDVEVPDGAIIHVHKMHVAALVYYEFNNFLRVGIEPGYAQRGAACVPGWNQPVFPDPPSGFVGDTRFALNYIDMPFFVSGNLNFFNDRLEVFGKVGYGFSFLASAYEEQVVSIVNPSPPNGENPVPGDVVTVNRTQMLLGPFSNLNRWDHGIYSGLGAGVNLGRHQVFLESSFYAAFNNAERFNVSQNRNLNFSLGYAIRL